MECQSDLLSLLNHIKVDELGGKAFPFTHDQLYHFCSPRRNRKHYHTFTIPKKSGGVRTISAPTKMLKSLLRCTNTLLKAFYDAPEDVTGFVRERSIVDNARAHAGMNYVFNTDLKDFFPSISKSRVWATLKTSPFNFNDRIADAVAGLCCTCLNGEDEPERIALPQGSPASPVLTNIVCRNLDRRLRGLARRFGLHYTRYADDITFSSMHNVYQEGGEFMAELRRIVLGQHFELNEKKTRLQVRSARQEVTGLVVNDKVNISRAYIRDLDNLLYIWQRHGRSAAFLKFVGRYVPKGVWFGQAHNMERVVAGRLAYIRMVKGECRAWRRLQDRFDRLIARGNHPVGSGGKDFIYTSFYTLDNFMKFSGLELQFILEDGRPKVFFVKDGVRTDITLSHYVRTRLRNILQSGSKEELRKFTARYIIAHCAFTYMSDAEGLFWLIIRSVPRKKIASLGNKDLAELITDLSLEKVEDEAL